MVNYRIRVTSLMLFISGILFAASASLASEDPTAPLNWMPPKERVNPKVAKTYPVPDLQGIVCKGQHRCYAVLNDILVNTNDTVDGYRVSEITQEKVVVIRGSRSYELTLFKSDIKK